MAAEVGSWSKIGKGLGTDRRVADWGRTGVLCSLEREGKEQRRAGREGGGRARGKETGARGKQAGARGGGARNE